LFWRAFVGRHGASGGIHHAEGVITQRPKRADEGTEFVGAGGLVWQYEYVLRDHLGNTRVTFADINGNGLIDPNTEINQINHYYPFGLNMEGNWNGASADAKNKYQFGGKESNDDFGLGLNDFGARLYDPAAPHFINIDPLAEKFMRYSPYTYCFNNPVLFIDPTGMAPATDPEGFVKHSGIGGDVSLPSSAVTEKDKNGKLTAFTIGDNKFTAQYDDKGGFTGYTNKKYGTYANPDISLRAGTGFDKKHFSMVKATFDVTNVIADNLQVIQVCYGDFPNSCGNDTQMKFDIDGVNYGGFVDGDAINNSDPYYDKPTVLVNNSGSITAEDSPTAPKCQQILRFETTIVATNYMGSGRDVKLATFYWGWNDYWNNRNKLGQGSIHNYNVNITPMTSTARAILNFYKPNFKFLGE
jgi:RHS repeat-associated protein